MEIRPHLLPPKLDESKVAQLSQLASALDGAIPGAWEDNLAEFNRLAETSIPLEEFQGISGAEEHADYVRRVLYGKQIRLDPTITFSEMKVIVRRILQAGTERDFYLELFIVNCKHPAKSDLIYWPSEVSELPKDREPTVEEIAALAVGELA